jgi:hypothetical protein
VFGELPKIFDRNFVIAFFLPAAIFVVSSIGLFAGFGLFPSLISFLRTDVLQGATTLGIASWLLGVLLLVLNYSIYRVLEGYGKYNPIRYLKKYERRRYNKLQRAITRLRAEIREADASGEEEKVLVELENKRDALLRKKAEEFPSDPSRLLPTAFGNALRAFEDYPSDMYEVDSIVVWVRLLAVIPKDYRDLLGTAKAQADFWVNLWLLGWLFAIEYLVMSIYSLQLRMIWVPFVSIAFALIAASSAKSAAIQWGDYVKSSFDLFLPKLHTKLKLPQIDKIKDERALWTRFSQMVIYHQKAKAFDRTIKPESGDDEQVDSTSAKASE